MQKRFGERGLAVVGISLDEEGGGFIQKFVREHGINYPVVLGNKEVAAAYDDVDALPTTFIIDREGKVVKGHRGFTPQTVLEAEVAPHLKRVHTL